MNKNINNFKVMSEQEIMEAVGSVKNGQYVRLGYKSEPAMKAAYKKMGYTVVKVSECTGRLGCNYENLKSTKELRASGVEKTAKKDGYYWIVENKIAGNSNTGKKYLRMTTNSGDKTKSQFFVFNEEGLNISDSVDYKELIVPSYFKSSKPDYVPEPVRNIKLENVIRINDHGCKMDL